MNSCNANTWPVFLFVSIGWSDIIEWLFGFWTINRLNFININSQKHMLHYAFNPPLCFCLTFFSLPSPYKNNAKCKNCWLRQGWRSKHDCPEYLNYKWPCVFFELFIKVNWMQHQLAKPTSLDLKLEFAEVQKWNNKTWHSTIEFNKTTMSMKMTLNSFFFSLC